MKKEIFKTIKNINLREDSDEVKIEFTDGSYITQHHEQDCCEHVWVSQIDGSTLRHINAELYSIDERLEDMRDDASESGTYTFYNIQTSKGYLDWRWQGESNGYYSESVTMEFHGSFVEL